MLAIPLPLRARPHPKSDQRPRQPGQRHPALKPRSRSVDALGEPGADRVGDERTQTNLGLSTEPRLLTAKRCLASAERRLLSAELALLTRQLCLLARQ